MKNLFIYFSLFILLNMQDSSAQNTLRNADVVFSKSETSSKNQNVYDNNQKIFNDYNKNYRNSGSKGRELLEYIHAGGIEKTADNVKAIRSLLASNVTSDEKFPLVRILGDFHTHNDKTGMNKAIEGDLKSLIYSDQKNVARAGALAYSRLGFFSDSNTVLLHAKNNGLIAEDEYFGELAHLVPFAPSNDQVDFVLKIKNSKSRYAAEILAYITQDPNAMRKLYPETKIKIQSYIEENEPEFGSSVGEFSFIDAVRYSTWLQSIAVLKCSAGPVSYEDFILERLNGEKIDPRKIMAFLVSSEGKN